ncbi:MAG: hypothetical protein QM504_11290 [Pseudomonadota bacterium]
MEVWNTWFANIENGDDEFSEVEEVLFSTLVLAHLDLVKRSSLKNKNNSDTHPDSTAIFQIFRTPIKISP